MPSRRQPVVNKKPEAIKKMFASVAHSYDFLNSLLSAGTDARWRRRAAAAISLPPNAVVLDLCTGTGKLALELRRRFPDAQIIGVDFCLEMLYLARRKGVSAPSLICADALLLPIKTSSCDLIAVAFGIRNFADLEVGLREIHRCLSPNGTALFLEFFPPNRGAFLSLYGFYLKRCLRPIADALSGVKGAYTYLSESVNHFITPAELSCLMKDIGFHKVFHRPLTGGIVHFHQGSKGG
jgi:demethylmenaquinone methyltransferase/2-methoxy-6-polyprenyl-1,4-benzoquinol methylase